MTTATRVAVSIEARHHQRLIELSCETCRCCEPVSTRLPDFAERVGVFFDRHGSCRTVLVLP